MIQTNKSQGECFCLRVLQSCEKDLQYRGVVFLNSRPWGASIFIPQQVTSGNNLRREIRENAFQELKSIDFIGFRRDQIREYAQDGF